MTPYVYWVQMKEKGTGILVEAEFDSMDEQWNFIREMRQKGYYLMDTCHFKRKEG